MMHPGIPSTLLVHSDCDVALPLTFGGVLVAVGGQQGWCTGGYNFLS
jgi:hypothetical protein